MQTTNLVLTILFTIEMVIKHVALGILGYWSNGFNALDGIIVIASLVDLGLQYSGITTVTVTVSSTFTLTITLTITLTFALTLTHHHCHCKPCGSGPAVLRYYYCYSLCQPHPHPCPHPPPHTHPMSFTKTFADTVLSLLPITVTVMFMLCSLATVDVAIINTGAVTHVMHAAKNILQHSAAHS